MMSGMINSSVSYNPFAQTTGGTSTPSGGAGTGASPALIKNPEICLTETDCAANGHYWWQEGITNPPACHAGPAVWYMEGKTQMVLIGVVGVAAILGLYGLYKYM